MLRSLLVGTNGSEWSRGAVDLGIAWARSLGVPVTFLGVVDLPGLTHGEPVPIGATAFKAERDQKLLEDAREQIDGALRSAVARAEEEGVPCRVRRVEGSPEEELTREVQRHDLLIVGKRAVPATDHDPAPSVTLTGILRHTPRPVVVSGNHRPEAPSVIVAYDGSRQAARTLASFVSSGLFRDRPIHVLGVSDEPSTMEPRIQRAVDFLAAHGLTAQTQILSEEHGISTALADAAKRLAAGLLVMGAHGQPRIKEMLFGSVTRSMLARVPVPLFLDH